LRQALTSTVQADRAQGTFDRPLQSANRLQELAPLGDLNDSILAEQNAAQA